MDGYADSDGYDDDDCGGDYDDMDVSVYYYDHDDTIVLLRVAQTSSYFNIIFQHHVF